jgi:coenzyme F420-0:L-glutamate ligase/coenzyme F420-1:gamma-L-glutamate ligase
MKVELIGIDELPEIEPGADLAGLIAARAAALGEPLRNSDLLVVTQKIVSKAEGRRVALSSVVPSAFALQWAANHGLDPRLVELVLRESRRIVRMDRGVLIVETHRGFVCANAGVDISNVAGGQAATLLPEDPDASARRIRDAIAARTGAEVAVLVSDTFGRPWREGLINVAIGAAGIEPLKSYVGATDPLGLPLQATIQAVADEIAAAAGLISSKLSRTPAVLVRGLSFESGSSGARGLLRPPERDLFR